MSNRIVTKNNNKTDYLPNKSYLEHIPCMHYMTCSTAYAEYPSYVSDSMTLTSLSMHSETCIITFHDDITSMINL